MSVTCLNTAERKLQALACSDEWKGTPAPSCFSHRLHLAHALVLITPLEIPGFTPAQGSWIPSKGDQKPTGSRAVLGEGRRPLQLLNSPPQIINPSRHRYTQSISWLRMPKALSRRAGAARVTDQSDRAPPGRVQS